MPVGRPEQCYISYLILNLVEFDSQHQRRGLFQFRICDLIIAWSGIYDRLKRRVHAIPLELCKHFRTETTVKQPLTSSHLAMMTLGAVGQAISSSADRDIHCNVIQSILSRPFETLHPTRACHCCKQDFPVARI
jgi:hypothetical protein